MLNPTQKQALKADVLAAPDPECVALEADPTSPDKAAAVAALYNLTAAPDYWVWNPRADVQAIFDAIAWKNFTPADAVPAADAGNQFLNRAMVCQGKQFNLQTILLGRDVLDGTKASIRTGLKDALQDVPAGAVGALVDAGWVPVRNAMERRATRAEKLLVVPASGTGTQADASTMGFEGSLAYPDVLDAMAS